MKSNHGFSLVELLIVVVVIAIIAAIAIPNLLAARRSANGGSALSSLRTLHGANIVYASTTGDGSYAGEPATVGESSLEDLLAANLVDSDLGDGDKSGYSFLGDRTDSTATELQTFYFAANPSTSSGILMTGTKRYGVATDGTIRYDGDIVNLGVPFDATTLAAAAPLAD